MLRYCRRCFHAGLLNIALAIGLSFTTSQASAAAYGQAEARPESITVVFGDNYPPYSMSAAGAQVEGAFKDYWELWSSRTGIKVNLQAIDWAKAQEAVLAGRADVIDMIFLTEQRKPLYDFTKPYTRIEVPIFFHNSISGIVDANSLQGFSVGVMDGDACIEELKKHNVVNLRRYSSSEALIIAAERQEVRVFCNDKPPTMYYLHKLGLEKEFRQTAPLYVGEFHRAVRKGNSAMLKIVEDGFAQISEAERKKIDEKWLGLPLDTHLDAFARSAGYALLVVLALALILVVWNRSLRRRVSAKTAELTGALSALRASQLAGEKTLDSLTATLEAIPDLLFEMDAEGRYLSYRAVRTDLLAAPPGYLVGQKVSDVMPPEQASAVMSALREAAEKKFSQGVQLQLELAGETFWFELSVARKKTNVGEGARFVVLSRDITERKRAEMEIEHLAFFDSLTLLPNRRFLLDRLRRGLASGARRGRNGAILFIDLDDFKTLNDTRGHQLGDMLLIQVSQRLQACIRTEDCVARLGGDEFVVLLEDLSSDLQEAATEAEAIGHKILAEISKAFLLDSLDYHCSASIGITLFSGREGTVDELLKRADAAMYRAKTAGRNALCFFDPAMQSALEERALLEAQLRRALPEEQLVLFYQAQLDAGMRIVGAEVLLRWRHPQRGLVGPMQFIPLAEESGLIVPIGYWVLEMACAQLKGWESNPLTRNLHLSVNVSARQFRQRDFVQQVRNVVSTCGVDPTRLKLELTESVVLDNVADTIEKMHQLKRLGVRFSMDDFGTGQSSLAYLKRLPLDQLKIDQSFVRDIATDQGDAAIVQTIIGMARNLGLNVIAEGVENEAQKTFLLDNGCMEFQGYLFSRPIPLLEFEKRLI